MTVGLVLGAAVWVDGPSPSLRRRAALAARLWAQGRVSRLVATGGPGRFPPTEAEAIRDLLIASGVPADRIALEPCARSTEENIRLSLPLIGSDPVLIVTDWYHAPRAALTARAHGLTARCATVPPRASLGQVRAVLREALALPVYFWRLGRLTRPPRGSK